MDAIINKKYLKALAFSFPFIFFLGVGTYVTKQ
jgi:hypothetical protein